MRLRAMRDGEREQVAELIWRSTNAWYQAAGRGVIFRSGPESCLVFCNVYEDLDPGCCIVAEDPATGRLAGSCFHHPRPTHVSLGIMNVHPDFFGRGVASALLKFITDLADQQRKPVRLVSSAMNLDSFSLYTRAGFVPRAVYQDFTLAVPAGGLPAVAPAGGRIRPANPDDARAMADLERELCGIERERDFRYFIENRLGIWNVSVLENHDGRIDGFLCSVNDPGCNMLGPGVSRDDDTAAALIAAERNRRPNDTPVFLIPADRPVLVRRIYEWGGRNCELHFHQIRGDFQKPLGVAMPSFLPESA